MGFLTFSPDKWQLTDKVQDRAVFGPPLFLNFKQTIHFLSVVQSISSLCFGSFKFFSETHFSSVVRFDVVHDSELCAEEKGLRRLCDVISHIEITVFRHETTLISQLVIRL
jgi:hypothetical protein